jgi:putative N6-adenine-specific DNA methylase
MRFVAKTLYGLENVLADELKELGAADIKPANRAVLFTGNLEMLYKVNYCSRCALSILVSVDDFRIRSKEDLYNRTLRIDWSSVMDPDSTFSVVPVVNSNLFGHTGYPGLIVKDAIADHFRNKTGRRPSVDTADPAVMVNLHISNDNVNLSIDSSVAPLFKRGYRKVQGEAPLNEVLAAGIQDGTAHHLWLIPCAVRVQSSLKPDSWPVIFLRVSSESFMVSSDGRIIMRNCSEK